MNTHALPAAILRTKEEISQVKRELERVTDHKERRRLSRRLKELQYLQLWQLEKWEQGFEIEVLEDHPSERL